MTALEVPTPVWPAANARRTGAQPPRTCVMTRRRC